MSQRRKLRRSKPRRGRPWRAWTGWCCRGGSARGALRGKSKRPSEFSCVVFVLAGFFSVGFFLFFSRQRFCPVSYAFLRCSPAVVRCRCPCLPSFLVFVAWTTEAKSPCWCCWLGVPLSVAQAPHLLVLLVENDGFICSTTASLVLLVGNDGFNRSSTAPPFLFSLFEKKGGVLVCFGAPTSSRGDTPRPSHDNHANREKFHPQPHPQRRQTAPIATTTTRGPGGRERPASRCWGSALGSSAWWWSTAERCWGGRAPTAPSATRRRRIPSSSSCPRWTRKVCGNARGGVCCAGRGAVSNVTREGRRGLVGYHA